MMRLSKDDLELLISQSTDIVVGLDRKGIVFYYNDGAERSLGYEPHEVMGTFVGQLYSSVDEAKRVMEAMRSREHGGVGVAESIQTKFLSKKGEEIPVAISGTILYDKQGEEEGSIGFAKDLREILRKDQLATLGEVAIGLSHEINNPLTVILNQTELLERDLARLAGERDSSVENERLDAVRREIGRITEILDRLSHMVEDETYETVEYVGPSRMIDLGRRTANREPDPRLAGRRILVVDDDLGILRSMSEILQAEGCEAVTADNGAAALERLSEGHYDAILSDVVMPEMDGYELFRVVDEKYPGLPVLMMTAFTYDKDHIIKRSRLKGLQAVIFKKPVDPERLRESLIEAIAPKGA